MALSSPLFSIVIPTFNRAHLITKTIESVLAQDCDDFELLVIDDGSKDNTEDVVRRISDERLIYFRKENAERGAARNFGFGKSRGAYVNFFDSDDLMYTNHLKVARALIDLYHHPEWFHLGYDFKGPDGSLHRKVDNFDDSISDLILFDNKLSCNGVFVRNDIAKDFPFEENRTLASSEDWELWIRLVSRFNLLYSNEITSTVVNHDQRSIATIPADKVVARDMLFVTLLKKDKVVMRHYGDLFRRFVAERYSFFMLVNSEQGRSRAVWKWALRAFTIYPLILKNKRFLASLKNSLLK